MSEHVVVHYDIKAGNTSFAEIACDSTINWRQVESVWIPRLSKWLELQGLYSEVKDVMYVWCENCLATKVYQEDVLQFEIGFDCNEKAFDLAKEERDDKHV